MKKVYLFLLIISLFFIQFIIYAEPEREDNWPMFGGSSTGARANLAEKSAKPPYKVAWDKTPNYHNSNFCSEPIIAEKVVYMINENKELTAYSLENGRVLWFVVGTEMFLEPAYYKGNLLVLSKGGSLYSLDAKTGKEKWSKSFPCDFIYPPLLFDNKLYLLGKRTVGCEFYALNALNGAIVWKKSFPTLNTNEFVVNDQIICFNSFDENDKTGLSSEIVALSVKNGNLLWRTKLQSANPPILSLNMIYAGTSNQDFYALDAQTGKIVWNTRLDINPNKYSIYYNHLAVQCANGKFFMLDALTGKIYWNVITGGNSTYIFSANGMVYLKSFFPLSGRNILSGEVFVADKSLYESVLIQKYQDYSKYASIGNGYLVAVGKNCIAAFKSTEN